MPLPSLLLHQSAELSAALDRVAGNRPPLSPLGVDRLARAAIELLGALDGLAEVDGRLAEIVRRQTSAEAMKLRLELQRNGYRLAGPVEGER